MSCGVVCKHSSDLALLWLWLWLWPAAVALTRPLAWEAPCAMGAAIKTKKKKKKKIGSGAVTDWAQVPSLTWESLCTRGEANKRGKEKEIMDENGPNLMKDMNINIQEAQQTPNKMNSKRPMLRHIVKSNFPKRKRILKAVRTLPSHTKDLLSIRILANFSSEALEARNTGLIYPKC